MIQPLSNRQTPVRPPVRPRWARLASGQESGLIVVILCMVLGLTLATPSITRADRKPVPIGAVVVPGGENFTVTLNGQSTIYRAADGYELIDADPPIIKRSFQVNKFLNKENLIGVVTEASFIAIMAVGMAGIIIMGGIDLSIGSVYALAAVLGAKALHELGPNAPAAQAIPVGLVMCCAVGAMCGAVNGIATVGLRVHPFIITLGGLAVYRGVAFVLTRGQSVGDFPRAYTLGFFRASWGGVNPVPTIFMIVVAALGAVILSRTVFGRQTFAIGGNETAGRYAGIHVGRVKIALFTASGLLAGLAAAIMLGYYGAVASNAGDGYELDVIAAAVVGGASLSGGRGSALGAVLGAIVIKLIKNGIVVLGIDSNYQMIIIGLAIVIAVVIDQAKQRLTSGRV